MRNLQDTPTEPTPLEGTVTDTDIIQPARDVLAKWCAATTKPFGNAYPWTIQHEQAGRANWSDVIVDRDGDWLFDYTDPDDELGLVHKGSADPDIARLIVGTAGNPDLLDAIDGLLANEQKESGVCHCGDDLAHHTLEHNFVDMGYPSNPLAERIAAAIIAADQRMSNTTT